MILLDTCTLLWLASDLQKLSSAAKTALQENASNLSVSAITAFEIGIKFQKKLLILPLEPLVWFQAVLSHHGIKEIHINSKISILSTSLPPIHKDPCDRFIISTAQTYKFKIITPDTTIKSYPNVKTIW